MGHVAPSLADRAAGAVLGAFIGDALGLGPHWYYDLEELRREFGPWIDGYTAPRPGRYHEGCPPGRSRRPASLRKSCSTASWSARATTKRPSRPPRSRPVPASRRHSDPRPGWLYEPIDPRGLAQAGRGRQTLGPDRRTCRHHRSRGARLHPRRAPRDRSLPSGGHQPRQHAADAERHDRGGAHHGLCQRAGGFGPGRAARFRDQRAAVPARP